MAPADPTSQIAAAAQWLGKQIHVHLPTTELVSKCSLVWSSLSYFSAGESIAAMLRCRCFWVQPGFIPARLAAAQQQQQLAVQLYYQQRLGGRDSSGKGCPKYKNLRLRTPK